MRKISCLFNFATKRVAQQDNPLVSSAADISQLQLSGHHSYEDGRKAIEELKKVIPANSQWLAEEVEQVLIAGWTGTDEALHRINSASRQLKAWRTVQN